MGRRRVIDRVEVEAAFFPLINNNFRNGAGHFGGCDYFAGDYWAGLDALRG